MLRNKFLSARILNYLIRLLRTPSPFGGRWPRAGWGNKINLNIYPPIRPIGHLPPEGEGVLSGARGFTLIEILIALFIFTILSVMLTSAMHNILNTQTTTRKHSERMAELQVALLLMSRDIEQIVNRPIMNAKNTPEFPVVGTPQMLSLTHGGLVNPLNQLPRSSLQRTRYSWDKGKLIRETWIMLDQTANAKADARTLLENVLDMQFDYLDEKNNFVKSWPPPTQQQFSFPRAVRVTLNLKDWGKITQLYLIPVQNLRNTDAK